MITIVYPPLIMMDQTPDLDQAQFFARIQDSENLLEDALRYNIKYQNSTKSPKISAFPFEQLLTL